MDGKEFLDNYWRGVDTNVDKPIILTNDKLITILNNFKQALNEDKNNVVLDGVSDIESILIKYTEWLSTQKIDTWSSSLATCWFFNENYR